VSVAAVAEAILDSPRFSQMHRELTVRSLLRDLPALSAVGPECPVDWNYLLGCASVLAATEGEQAQEAALRVAQACVCSTDTLDNQREAAVVLLERMGNRPALDLARQRGLLEAEAWREAPAPLRLDVVRRRLELSIPVTSGEQLDANGFQREFWDALARAGWVSVSAATSAGKSYLVKRWFAECAFAAEQFRGVYVVPTRALIEEVSLELREHFDDAVGIFTIPWDQAIGTGAKEIHVLTQERLHLLQERLQDFAADVVFVDEAQKLADGERGILLQRVLDDAVRRNPGVQMIFASPQSENPALLLDSAPDGAERASLLSETITVNQNLVWAGQVRGKPRSWRAQLILDSEPVDAGSFQLQASPNPTSQRLPLVAVALGGDGGNVVYVNGAADAEKAALQIYDALGADADISGDDAVGALRELVVKTVHPGYSLERVLARGVAFHYGNMPLIVRSEIERLFRAEELRFLVCTSTLLEGVNLPCQNLFARGPKKGRNKVMSPEDFWNLAGRAGRWGKEFEGNIVCVDATDEQLWPQPPRRRARQRLTRATDSALADIGRVRSYVAEGAPVERARAEPLLEAMYSFLTAQVLAGRELALLPGMASSDAGELNALEADITTALQGVSVPAEIYTRHAGISPAAMQRLLEYLADPDRQGRLLLAAPEDQEAASSYVQALGRCSSQLAANFGPPKRQWMLAVLITSWMRGYPLPRLIDERVSFKKLEKGFNLPKVIRETMEDVEQEARFRVPKYLACYEDVLAFHLRSAGREDEAAVMPDVAMMLELGVSRDTHVSLMALGLSRTSAIALAEYIVDDELSREQCLTWLAEQDLRQLSLPVLVIEEVARLHIGTAFS
jgi:hypothetical protein